MNKRHIIIAAALSAIAVMAPPSLTADESHKHDAKNDGEVDIKEDVKPYPLDTCIVSDEKLGEMGKPVVFVYQGQEIKLCCKHCRKDFDKNPADYLKKLERKK